MFLIILALQVSWYQNSFPIQSTDRRIMNSRGNRHTLNIRHIQQEDFGNYRWVHGSNRISGIYYIYLYVHLQLWKAAVPGSQRWFSQFGNFCYNLLFASQLVVQSSPLATEALPYSRDTHRVRSPRPALGNCLFGACLTHFADKQVFYINVNLSETY